MGKAKRKKAKKVAYDWTAIRADFRTGQFSIRQLSDLHGPAESTIRKRIRKEKWARDLAEEARARTKDALVRDAVEPGTTVDDEAAIEAAALRGADVVRAHRQILTRLRMTGEQLLSHVENHLGAKDDEGKMATIIPKDLGHLSRAYTGAAGAYARVIPMERQAFGLEDGDGQNFDSALEELA